MKAICVPLDPVAHVADGSLIGGKAMGLLFLQQHGFPTLPAVALTTEAFDQFCDHARLLAHLSRLDRLDPLSPRDDPQNLILELRETILAVELPRSVLDSVSACLSHFGPRYEGTSLAVRSSCAFEDLKAASFAGIYESCINVPRDQVDSAVRRCYASLFTERSLVYALKNGFKPSQLKMGVAIQPAIDSIASGVAFTVDPETGCEKNVLIESAFGLGQGVVSGEISSDVFVVNKKTRSLIRKSLGQKPHRYSFRDRSGTERRPNDPVLATSFSLTEMEVTRLFEVVSAIEQRMDQPADIEWAKTGLGDFVILQARPLRTRSADAGFVEYLLEVARDEIPLLTGQPITDKIVVGHVRHATDKSFVAARGEVIVAHHVDVDWAPRLRDAAAVITEGGGYTSHIAIILREMGVPALFGAEHAFETLQEGVPVTVACNQRPGSVWAGQKPYRTRRIDPGTVYQPRTKVHLVTSSLTGLDGALKMPVHGIGLVRLEFLISETIGIHPKALVDSERGEDLPAHLREAVRARLQHFASPTEFYIEMLCEAICAFASRCPDQTVNVRFADLLSDDYLSLAGGEFYEREREANPMLGWRGTSRLIDPEYVDAFILDCLAFRKVVDEKGFDNVRLMLPFCRTPEDAATASDYIRTYGPARAPIGMMVEVPSNVALADEFAGLMDFFLVGPMDLTQLTYGADRKSKRLSRYNDATAATREMVKFFLSKIVGRSKRVYIGGWPLFQYLDEYLPLLDNNELCLVELPDRLPELFENLRRIEARVYGPAALGPSTAEPIAHHL